jgi:hypothetical protein
MSLNLIAMIIEYTEFGQVSFCFLKCFCQICTLSFFPILCCTFLRGGQFTKLKTLPQSIIADPTFDYCFSQGFCGFLVGKLSKADI